MVRRVAKFAELDIGGGDFVRQLGARLVYPGGCKSCCTSAKEIGKRAVADVEHL